MLLLRSVSLFGFLFAIGTGLPSSKQHRIALEQDQRLGAPEGWTVNGNADASSVISLVLAIKLNNLEALEQTFWDVSTPDSPRYGKHLSLKEVDALVHPTEESLTAVKEWLAAHNIDDSDCRKLKGNGFWTCHVPVSVAAPLLHTSFEEVEETATGRKMVRATRQHYTVPASVAEHLDFVGGVHRFPGKKVGHSNQNFNTQLGVTAHSLRTRYNVSDTVGKMDSNSQAVAQFLGQYFHQPDLVEFWLEFGHFPHKHKIDKYIGPDTGLDGTEAALDVEYIMSLGANISTWFWSTGGKHEGQERFLDWITGVANTSDAPWVHSVSYGDDEDSLDMDYMERINTEFQKMGARGLSIMFASGDSGTGCDNDKFVPSFPATSPFVTAVGGTLVTKAGKAEEGNYISGGGFSNVFPQPDYQNVSIPHFLATSDHLPDAKYYNKTGRAYPDVSAASAGFLVVVNLIPLPGVAGTSCACPTFSGIISLVNDLRLEAAGAPLGFLNPLLYKAPGAFYDVPDGCNSGCQQTGFCAQAGWDPVTGLGSPNYATMKTLLV